MAGGAGAHSPARMLEINAGSSVERDVQNAARQACRPVGELGGIDLEDDGRTIRAAEGDFVRLLREFDFRFFNIWIDSAHVVFSLLRDRELPGIIQLITGGSLLAQGWSRVDKPARFPLRCRCFKPLGFIPSRPGVPSSSLA